MFGWFKVVHGKIFPFIPNGYSIITNLLSYFRLQIKQWPLASEFSELEYSPKRPFLETCETRQTRIRQKLHFMILAKLEFEKKIYFAILAKLNSFWRMYHA